MRQNVKVKRAMNTHLVVVVVARSLVVVVELPRVLEGRQAQEGRGRWGILPEGSQFKLCRFGRALE